MNIFVQFWIEYFFELNDSTLNWILNWIIFLARFNVKMNNQNLSAVPTSDSSSSRWLGWQHNLTGKKMLLIIISYIIIWPATKISHVFEVMEGLTKRGKTKRNQTSMLVEFFGQGSLGPLWNQHFWTIHFDNIFSKNTLRSGEWLFEENRGHPMPWGVMVLEL